MQIGFIGIGLMGFPMAKNLLKSGYKLKVFNRSQDKAKRLKEFGAELSTSIKAAVTSSDVIITMLTDDAAVEKVISSDEFIKNIKPNATVIDMSSINPVLSKKCAKALKEKKQQTTKSRTISTIGDTTLESDWTSAAGQMKGSPNKLIGDTMNINPGAVPPNQAQNDLGAQPIISADGSQPNARAIDIAAIANPYATPGADFNPQSKMKAESIFGSPMQRQGLMNLGTPLHDAGHGAKQSHSHPSKTTTKMKPDGEYPGARYVKGDLVDQDDLLDKTKLDAHIATQVQSDKKGTFIKEKSDDGPGSDIETSKGFGKKIRLGSMGRSSYTSNMKDQLDPNDFLFKNTPKK